MSDTIASKVSPGAHFTTRLAAHLADVKNADRAHRIVNTETNQKLEALTRMVYELYGQIQGLLDPSEPEPCEACGDPECDA